MSYCEIWVFKQGKPTESSTEFRNAWGGAAFIWSALYDKYLKDPKKEYDSWLFDANRVWELARRIDLPLFERAVLASTFDYAIIRNEHFLKFGGHLREFVNCYSLGDKVCHLRSWAIFIEKMSSTEIDAVGFYGNSGSDNLWLPWDQEKDECVPYDLTKNNKHFEVYDWLQTQGKAA